jgi:prophage antirepressor-like protein
MIEEIKTDNNCIVKAFENNPISIIEEDNNSKKVYYFKASDIGKALKLSNIAVSIQHYDEDERVIRKAYDTTHREQDTTFLTSQGVYRLLYNSKKEIAKKFRKWAGNILDDIIFNQSKELQRQLKEKEKLLIEQKEQTELEKEQLLEKTLLNQFPNNTQCIYYGKVDNKDVVGGNLVKFGMSNNLQERVKTHKKTYTNFRLTNVFKVSNQIEIENCIKKHPILKKRIRNIMINDMNYRELICINSTRQDPDFSLEKLNEYIEQIIEENQYNIENYNRLLQRNNELEIQIIEIKNKNKTLQEENDELQKKLDSFTPSVKENLLKKHNKVETSNGYSLFVFNCNVNIENQKMSRYKIGLCKTSSIELREKAYKLKYENGSVNHCIKLKHPFMEKVLLYLLKRHLIFLNNDLFDASFDDVKLIFNIIFKLEELLVNNDLYNIMKILNNETLENVLNDPEIPFIKKAKRSIDQIDKDTGKIIATFPSIEAAGRSLGLTTGTAIGVALRNKTICQGFVFRYSGISKEDQMLDQPVIRIQCKTGEQKNYPNIASAARDAKISPPGLRNRILTDVHYNGYHWIFNKTATHYTI